ncbi:bifunctional helix-turn-helix transcriptional regulator/GNAT family N-acetyltransferase [Sphingomonas sp. GlSt437]|uniref:bifunctional helix-turn-helix transcriptional regulator/GNAT family N-acetyltransferase n=1 Tax=Sphingomonas sp. GlSt437 TaxID=3389970 RepID=UPI003A8656F4
MDETIDAVRRFNRFFTLFSGALNANFLGSGMSLAEARLLFEIANGSDPLATDLQGSLGMDAGYVSRVIGRFEQRGWVERGRDGGDRRRRPIRITDTGRAAFDDLDRRQRKEVADVVERLDNPARARLTAALTASEALLAGKRLSPYLIRTFRPGDMGLIVSRQAILYHELYGWGAGLEANEAEVVAAFLRNFRAGRAQCWIAEVDGEMAGSVLVTDEGDGLCRLRLLYVEPSAHGKGIGTALVRECITFARSAGYQRMTLWTHSILEAARHIYAREGFHLISTLDHSSFGPMLTGETWELSLETH